VLRDLLTRQGEDDQPNWLGCRGCVFDGDGDNRLWDVPHQPFKDTTSLVPPPFHSTETGEKEWWQSVERCRSVRGHAPDHVGEPNPFSLT
jgi:hypothetical protein